MDHDGGASDIRPAETVATWPAGSFAENLAVAGDGTVLVALHTDRRIDRFDPGTGAVSRFAALDAPVAGLAIMRDGALYAGGGTPGRAPGLVWRIGPDGTVETVAEVADALFLNGMALHPDGRRLLVAESALGRVLAVDPDGGGASVWLDDPLLRAPAGDAAPGANGIKLAGRHAIISVTARDLLVRAAVRPDGSAGPIEVLAGRLRADDFAVGADGALYVATHPARSLVRLGPDGARSTLAGPAEGLTGATAVAFGRGAADRAHVYVTTTGGTGTLPPDQCGPARLVRVAVDATAPEL